MIHLSTLLFVEELLCSKIEVSAHSQLSREELQLIKLLNRLGFELREACNGQEAIAPRAQAFGRSHSGKSLSRTWLPHLDGYANAHDGRLRRDQTNQSHHHRATTAIIAVTASALEEERAVVKKVGCDDFLRKPFREANIFAIMNNILECVTSTKLQLQVIH